MKPLSLCLLVVLTALSVSCKKTDSPTVNATYAMMANRNNDMWTATPTASMNPSTNYSDTIIVHGYRSSREEHLELAIRRTGDGRYQLIDNLTHFYNMQGQDTMLNQYKLDPYAGNSVIIVNIDHTNHTIKGKFNLTFKKTDGDMSYPEVFTFNTGSFMSELHE